MSRNRARLPRRSTGAKEDRASIELPLPKAEYVTHVRLLREPSRRRAARPAHQSDRQAPYRKDSASSSRAFCQSRRTVRSVTPIAAATSLSVMPAK